ncbi:hypothetical protein NB464_21545 [Vibrio diabolicus]|uniref:hypothetical protein n=1 Tax=Vibrio harveyi group TaxID=717610 RepID=UPI00215C9207|nr:MULTISPECIES: hypothetical protein [Vibrio harveyi group]MCR9305479.1 hypothetical protein [Vibrio diabolicus]MCR9428173.1 hypothetical protein [Vibrio diabolicus]MCS0224233.1 hypothetical protein [Vibrio alginolyticus]MCS0320688.1 hypothetical protein [Vibrio diabolicus]MCS0452480.1 hypothetical protein [Vibrio diabolicus]
MINKINTEIKDLKPIDIETLNQLLANKQTADARLKRALKHRATFSEQIDGKEDSGLFNDRIVAVVKRGNPTTRLLEYIEAAKAANKELLERAPQYFNSSSNSFKETTVIENVRRVNITINKAASSQKVTGARLAKRLEAYLRDLDRKLSYDLPEDEKEQLIDNKNTALNELKYFTDNADVEFRKRGQEHNDIVAIIHTYDGNNGGISRVAKKVHVNAGGLVLIRHRSCKDHDVLVTNNTTEGRSIYDEANAFKSVLYPNANMYIESEVDAIREARKELRNKNENKARSQFDGYVN